MSSKISPRLKRDFLRDLPVELALHCVSYLDDARTLGRAMRVSKYWNELLQDERLWRDMFKLQLYRPNLPLSQAPQSPPPAAGAETAQPPSVPTATADAPMLAPQRERPSFGPIAKIRRPLLQPQSYREQFRNAFLTGELGFPGQKLTIRVQLDQRRPPPHHPRFHRRQRRHLPCCQRRAHCHRHGKLEDSRV